MIIEVSLVVMLIMQLIIIYLPRKDVYWQLEVDRKLNVIESRLETDRKTQDKINEKINMILEDMGYTVIPSDQRSEWDY
jgi:hypothetical protein